MSAHQMQATLARIRGVVGTQGVERLHPDGVRLLLRELLYDGHSVPDWHADAACRNSDVCFFATTAAGVEQAKAVCRSCPVRAVCVADVMAWEQQSRRYGVAGGMSVNDRRRLFARLPATWNTCEVCGSWIARRPIPEQRRCADHVDQLVLVPIGGAA